MPDLTPKTTVGNLFRTPMILRSLFIVASAVCLLGCGRNTDSTTDNSSATDSSTAPTSSEPAKISPADDPELIETETGLKYKVIKRGEGTISPKPTDKVLVHYHGTLLDGRVFDSTRNTGRPMQFPLNAVIPGWTEGLQLMKVGDKFKFIVPPGLAYADQGSGAMIGPNTTLVFEIELLGIN